MNICDCVADVVHRYEDSVTSEKDEGQRLTWEYFPDKTHVVDLRLNYSHAHRLDAGYDSGAHVAHGDGDAYKYVVTNNVNQAMFIFSREQVMVLEDRCGWLTDVGKNAFLTQLRKALNANWKYLNVGVSEWSSSFQHILQCGVRRLVPFRPSVQTFMLHHSANKAQKRRLRRELLSMQDWIDMVKRKAASPVSLHTAAQIVFDQYNLGLIPKGQFGNSTFKGVPSSITLSHNSHVPSKWTYYDGWEDWYG